MKTKSKLILTLACATLCTSALAASDYSSDNVTGGNTPGSMGAGVAAAYYHFSSNRNYKDDNHVTPLVTLNYNIDSVYGVQALFGRLVSTDSSNDKNVGGWLAIIDGVYRFSNMPALHLQPYAVAGLGVTTMKESGSGQHRPANVNGGVGIQYFISSTMSFDASLRDLYTFSHKKNEYMAALGLNILFNGTNSSSSMSDDDVSNASAPAKVDHAVAHFDLNSAKVTAADKATIQTFANTVKPTDKVQVDGYSDNKGSDKYNQYISQKRADSVKHYLKKNGVKGSAITAQGHGSDAPVADNATDAGRAQNRRVEASVVN